MKRIRIVHAAVVAAAVIWASTVIGVAQQAQPVATATYQAYERIGRDLYRVKVRINGDQANEQWFVANGQTLQQVADSISRQLADLNDLVTTKGVLDGIAPGASISVTRPATSADPDATWLAQVGQLQRAKALRDAIIAQGASVPAQFTTDYNALVTAVSNGYTTARGAKL
jgi:hypothetical protein